MQTTWARKVQVSTTPCYTTRLSTTYSASECAAHHAQPTASYHIESLTCQQYDSHHYQLLRLSNGTHQQMQVMHGLDCSNEQCLQRRLVLQLLVTAGVYLQPQPCLGQIHKA